MDRKPNKPCKFCGGFGHFPYMCRQNPKVIARMNKPFVQNKPIARSQKPLKRTRLNAYGKVAKKWTETRKTWLELNPPPIEGRYYECYLQISAWCPRRLDSLAKAFDDDGNPNPVAVTLDHVVSRSSDPSKRFDLENLRPACWYCNGDKGSRSLDQIMPLRLT